MNRVRTAFARSGKRSYSPGTEMSPAGVGSAAAVAVAVPDRTADRIDSSAAGPVAGSVPAAPKGSGVPGIDIRDLSKRFGDTLAVDRLSFKASPGMVTCFLGPNGAGKTTTLRMLLGLVKPTAGTATIGGQAYADLLRPICSVGASLEASSYHPARSGRNHLRVYGSVAGCPESRVDEVLALVGLTGADRMPVRAYSLGMRQRLGLATALMGDPPVLVLDEPSNGLDPAGIAWLRGFLRGLAGEGRTVLVSSHALSEVQQIADHLVIINRGRLVRAGTLEEVSAGQGQRVLVRSPHLERLVGKLTDGAKGVSAVGSATAADAAWVMGLSAEAIGRTAYAHRIELHALETHRDGLERIFMSLTGTEEVP